MTRPTGMPKGRPQSDAGLREDLHAEAVATGYELLRHDQYELAALETIDELLEQPAPDVHRARRVLGELRRRDIDENHRHRHIVRTLAPASEEARSA